MLGELPKKLNINGKEWTIRSDFRVVLNIFQAMNDVELDEAEKVTVMLDCLYTDFSKMESDDYEEAMKQSVWFINGGKYEDNKRPEKKILDWEQDEQIIFSAVNKVANCELRSKKYVHWWTFLGYFSEIGGEGLFATVINIRNKKNQGKKLEKYEQEFYKKNKTLIDFKEKYTEEELQELERIRKLFF